MNASIKSFLRPLLLPWASVWDPLYVGWVRRRTGFQKPIPPIHIRRRKGGSGADAFWFVESGRLDAGVFLDAIARYCDRPLAKLRVLDFGVGIGRLLSCFDGKCAELHATDVDDVSVAYVRRVFQEVQCHVNAEDPPMPLPSETLDVVFSFSVFTHLSASDQMAWLKDLARVLHPDGLAMISILTTDSVASRMKESLEWTQKALPSLEREGFYFTNYSKTGMASLHYELLAKSTSRYGYSVQTEPQVRRVWGELFEILEFTELVFRRHQTLVVLRKR
jgi:2-polyprenyl-3-methyl-5-hydroxy-6-metoxy-1,4-benzoquinol methylase